MRCPFAKVQPKMASSSGWPKWHLLFTVGFYTFLNEDFMTGFISLISFINLYKTTFIFDILHFKINKNMIKNSKLFILFSCQSSRQLSYDLFKARLQGSIEVLLCLYS